MRVGSWTFTTFLTLFGFIAVDPASAQEAEGPERPWSNTADLSVVITGGNSGVLSIALSDKFTYRWTRSQVVFEAAGLKTRTEERDLVNEGGQVEVRERSRTTAEEYALSGRYRYRFYEGAFAFSSAGWRRDEFAGIDNRYTGALGLGYQLLDAERTKLSIEVGTDWTREEPLDLAADEFVGAQVRTSLEQRLSDVAKLDSEVELLENLENTDDLRLNWFNAVTASLSEVFAIKLGYLVRYDNEPALEIVPGDDPGEPAATFAFDKTDTRFSASLVVNF